MKYLGKPFIQDSQGIFYLDSKDVELTKFNFNEITPFHSQQRNFYYISGIDDYIIKDTTKLPMFFNQSRTRKILRNFQINQDKFNDIDFPVGYYLEKNEIKGTIIPYYKDSISVKKLTNFFAFEELKKYYNHDDDEIKNLIELCLDILKLIAHMYDNNIVYTDINAGNFLVYNNTIKVVDFEPEYVHFTQEKGRYLAILVSNYNILVNYIWRRFGFDNMLYNPGYSFQEEAYKVKTLYNEKRR